MADRSPICEVPSVRQDRRVSGGPLRGHRPTRTFGLIGSAAMLAAGGGAGILGAALLASPSGAAGTTWIVDSLGDGDANASHCAPPTNGACTLRDALEAEQTGDTITFDSSLSGGTIDLTATEGQLLVDHRGVTITGPGSDLLTVNQTVSSNPVFYLVAYNDNVVMSGFKITGGTQSGIAGYGVTDLTLNDMEITGNSGPKGGGLYLDNFYGDLTLTNSYIHNNTGTNAGGGIYVPSTASQVVGSGSVHISSTVISNNTSGGRGGGGVLGNSASVTIENSTFSGNESGNGGGALYILSTPTSVDITGSTFDSNTAYYQGGGILSSSPAVTISNSTFTANTGMGGGGLSALHGQSLTINQSTFTGNMAVGTDPDYFGGGGINFRASIAVSLSGSIVSANSASITDQSDIGLIDASSTSMTSSHSLLGEIDTRISLLGAGNLRVNTPLLGVLADNGGPTKTMALLLGSPAINAGPNPVATFEGNSFDQRGEGYPRVIGSTVDIGAVEFLPEPEPTTTTSTSTSTTSADVDVVVPQFAG